ncbi:MAG TPA: hypothetical protein VFE78_31855 [Gemmataceae bacterium]|nr:hypothetical protein [Gemmataceae bacterium]
MSAELLTCPYCNAEVTVARGTPAGRRVPCPRCDESFPYRPSEGVTLSPPQGPQITAEPPAPEVPAIDTFRFKLGLLLGIVGAVGAVTLAYIRSADVAVIVGAVAAVALLWLWFFRVRRGNQATAVFVLANMALVAAAGLALALRTQAERRAHDAGLPHGRRPSRGQPEPPVQGVPAPPEAVAPDRLAALGYLAPDTSVVAGVHVAELLADDAGKRLLNDPIKVGSFQFRLGGLEGWTGLRPEEVGHVVVGVKADDPLPPRLNVVVRTRQPYDAAKVRAALKARRAGGGQKELYRFDGPGGVPLVLWCADERTLVVGLLATHLEAVPLRPRDDLGSLVPELRPILRERMRPAGPVWAAGHAADWANTAAAPLLERLGKDDRDRIRSVRTFGVWLQPGRELTVNAAFRCADPAAARGLGEYAQSRWGKATNLKVVADEGWLTLQLRTDAAAVGKALAR